MAIRGDVDPCQPSSLPIAASVEVLLDDASRLQEFGRLSEALVVAHEAVQDAEKIGASCGGSVSEPARSSSPTLAAAGLRLAQIQSDRGEPRLALETLFRAQLHAVVCRDDVRYAESRLQSAEIMVMELGQVDQARGALADAEAQIERLGGPPDSALHHEQWRIAGLIAEAEGDHARAYWSYERSLAALHVLEHHPLRAARLLSDMGRSLRRGGNEAAASAAERRAMGLLSDALGTGHPLVEDQAACIALEIGRLRAHDGQHHEAVAFYREAVERGLAGTTLAALAEWTRSEHVLGRSREIARLGTQLESFMAVNDGLPVQALAQAESALGRALVDRDPEGTVEWLGRAVHRWSTLMDREAEGRDRLLLARVLHQRGRDADALDHIMVLRRNLDTLHPNEIAFIRRLHGEIAVNLPPSGSSHHDYHRRT